MAYSILRLARPRTFLYLMSLRTGTTLITVLATINKVSGLYGILALLTGFHLSPLQLSMYLYSLAALALLMYLAPHIARTSPLQNLLLAYFYLLDSVVNLAYTAFFALAWFAVLAQHNSPSGSASTPAGNGKVPGGSTIDETAGFTSPEFNVSHVSVDPASGELVGHGADQPAGGNVEGVKGAGALHTTLLQSSSVASIGVVTAMWAARVYCVLVVFAYARGCVRQAIVQQSGNAGQLAATTEGRAQDLAENPFRQGTELGAGWKGRLGRALTGVMARYWLGAEQEGEWVRMEMGDRSGKRSRKAGQDGIELGGVPERERRRRAGTGPPKPNLSVDVPKK